MLATATKRPIDAASLRLHASGAHTLRVLVADDEPFVRKFMAAVLLRDGHEVREAQDGLEALHLIEAHPESFDVLITDVQMPRMDGLTLARRVRERFPGIDIMYVTAYSPEAAEGVSPRVLRKPFRPQALIAGLRELVAPQHLRCASA